MSIISSKSSSLPTPSTSSGLTHSRDAVKDLILRCRTPIERDVVVVLDRLEKDGNVRLYERFLHMIQEEDFNDSQLIVMLEQSIKCVPRLQQHFRGFVEVMTGIDWTKRPPDVIKHYQTFIMDLLIAHQRYTNLVVSRLISYFIPKEDQRDQWKHGIPESNLKIRLQMVHKFIQQLLNVIPMMFQTLFQQISQWFPFYKKPSHVFGGYIYNLLLITEYRPIYQEDILSLIVSKLLELDVSISRHEIEDSEITEDDEQFEELDVKPIDILTANLPEDEMRYPLAESLDVGLNLLFDYVKREIDSFEGDVTKLNKFYNMFSKIFEFELLPTHNSHHVQFIIFYLCSFEPAFVEKFMNILWVHVRDFNLAPALRQAAIGYLCSFLARSRYVPQPLLRSTLSDMCTWVHQYIDRSDCVNNNSIKAHTVFYAVCQAIFYVIAFRSRDLTSDRRGLIFLQSLQLQAIVTSQLNPLRVCLPAIATTFAGVMRAHQLAYCHTILERNARRKLATVYSNGAQAPDECLETFFPFDPYLLKKSGKRMNDLYIQYQAEDFHDSSHDSQHLNHSETSPRGVKREITTNTEEDDFISPYIQSKRIKAQDEHELL
uniref:CSON001623 protein n=1 Tax=Culicoides sonorensis TaxID=179676 RepID=A0A336MUU1_CULSO